jgi:hypothetical protein
MNNKERIARLRAMLSDEAMVEFNIEYNACFSMEEKTRLLCERIAAVVKAGRANISLLQAEATSKA